MVSSGSRCLAAKREPIAILEKSGTAFEASNLYQERYLAELDASSFIHKWLLFQYSVSKMEAVRNGNALNQFHNETFPSKQSSKCT